MGVNGIDVFAKFGSWGGVDFLNALEATTLDEGLLGFGVLGKHLRELGSDVGEDVVGGANKQRFQRGEMSAHLDDVLQSLLGLVLQVRGTLVLLHHVDGKEAGGDVGLSQVLGVVG